MNIKTTTPQGPEIYTSGTLGDAFIILLKLFDKNIKTINHCTNYINLQQAIKHIYSLLPYEISLNFHEQYTDNSYVPGYFLDSDTYNPFPELELPPVDEFDLPEEYNACSIQSGIDIKKHPWRVLNFNDFNIIENNKPLVLVGTDQSPYTNQNHEIIDMRGRTTLLQCFNIIKKSKHFYSPQGLLPFFALSQKIHSTIWLKHNVEIHGMNCRVNKVKEWSPYLKYIKQI